MRVLPRIRHPDGTEGGEVMLTPERRAQLKSLTTWEVKKVRILRSDLSELLTELESVERKLEQIQLSEYDIEDISTAQNALCNRHCIGDGNPESETNIHRSDCPRLAKLVKRLTSPQGGTK